MCVFNLTVFDLLQIQPRSPQLFLPPRTITRILPYRLCPSQMELRPTHHQCRVSNLLGPLRQHRLWCQWIFWWRIPAAFWKSVFVRASWIRSVIVHCHRISYHAVNSMLPAYNKLVVSIADLCNFRLYFHLGVIYSYHRPQLLLLPDKFSTRVSDLPDQKYVSFTKILVYWFLFLLALKKDGAVQLVFVLLRRTCRMTSNSLLSRLWYVLNVQSFGSCQSLYGIRWYRTQSAIAGCRVDYRFSESLPECTISRLFAIRRHSCTDQYKLWRSHCQSSRSTFS